MNTIKFQSREPLNPKDEDGKYVPVVSLYKGYDIWHRPFLAKNAEQYGELHKEYFSGASNVTYHYISKDPGEQLRQGGDFDCYFHYLVFRDDKEEIHKCIIFCAECFIMNEQGQTIDSFNS